MNKISINHLKNKLNSPQKSTGHIFFIIILLISTPISAQANPSESSQYLCGKTNPKEAQKLDSIIPSLYAIVSGKAGSKKNWHLLKELFAQNALITPVFHDNDGNVTAKLGSVDDFISLNQEIFNSKDFYEREVSRKTFTFGHMANILSGYESRTSLETEPYAKGINTFQLLNDGRRWCVISVTWDSHSKEHPLSKQQLEFENY